MIVKRNWSYIKTENHGFSETGKLARRLQMALQAPAARLENRRCIDDEAHSQTPNHQLHCSSSIQCDKAYVTREHSPKRLLKTMYSLTPRRSNLKMLKTPAGYIHAWTLWKITRNVVLFKECVPSDWTRWYCCSQQVKRHHVSYLHYYCYNSLTM